MNHLTETTFGTTLTAGTWLPVSLVKSFNPRPMHVLKPKVGIGRSNFSAKTLVKQLYEFDIELELIALEAAPAYDPYTMVQYIIEKLAAADGAPDQVLESFSLAATIDVATDEFWWLKGCMLDRVDIIGSAIDDLITMKLHGLAQSGDYGTTDPVSGTATRQAQPADLVQVPYGGCDILYDPTTPATIMNEVSSFRLSLIRDLDKRGSDATTGTLYDSFTPKARRWEVEIMKDFSSKTELEHFVDTTVTKITFEIPNATGGKIFALTGGYWLPPSGTPIRELDLLNLRLVGEFAELAVSTH